MDNAQSQLIEKLQSATNILVTVSRNPSVDQLAACLGATLLLNKLGKHATAVFSGQVPSTIEFLQPEDTLEKTTDSLRDFIIALDKTKADKLRYKVEDDMVRIFITPYRTSISQADLEFSQGDFNVDLVLAIGVHRQEDLDDAITAHGRILHDAVVTSINTADSQDKLGTINWTDATASSLAELVADIASNLGSTLLDQQIATALLTGIVAETERFSNEKTTPKAMSVSALLMSAGANQQLVATQLAEPVAPDQPITSSEAEQPFEMLPVNDGSEALPSDEPQKEPGTLEIYHDETPQELVPTAIAPEPVFESDQPPAGPEDSSQLDDTIRSAIVEPVSDELETLPETLPNEAVPKTSRLIVDAPQMSGTLTANAVPETEPVSINMLPSTEPTETSGMLPPVSDEMPLNRVNTRGNDITPLAAELPQLTDPSLQYSPPNQDFQPPIVVPDPAPIETPIVPVGDLDDARDEVTRALNALAATPEPISALNAQPVLSGINDPQTYVPEQPLVASPAFSDALQQAIPVMPPQMPIYPAPEQFALPTPEIVMPTVMAPQDTAPSPNLEIVDPNAPPPVPPPFSFSTPPPPAQPPQQ